MGFTRSEKHQPFLLEGNCTQRPSRSRRFGLVVKRGEGALDARHVGRLEVGLAALLAHPRGQMFRMLMTPMTMQPTLGMCLRVILLCRRSGSEIHPMLRQSHIESQSPHSCPTSRRLTERYHDAARPGTAFEQTSR